MSRLIFGVIETKGGKSDKVFFPIGRSKEAKPKQIHALIRIALKAFVLVSLLVTAKYAGDQVLKQLTPHLTPSTEPALHRLIMIAITAYMLTGDNSDD